MGPNTFLRGVGVGPLSRGRGPQRGSLRVAIHMRWGPPGGGNTARGAGVGQRRGGVGGGQNICKDTLLSYDFFIIIIFEDFM